MGSVVQNGWDQLTNQYIASIAFSLLYYDYVLTLDRECRLFWSRRGFKQWGSVLFFLNRYCGVIGHAPVIIQTFVQPNSAIYPFCRHLQIYHQILAIIMQTIVGFTFITRTYALYDRSRVVLVGLVSLALAAVAVGGCMVYLGKKLSTGLELPKESVGCPTSLSWSQAWHLAVAWFGVMIFDLIVVVMTLVRTIQINRRSGKEHTLTRVLIRDGVVYFGVISLATLSNVVTFLHGSEITRGLVTTITNVLACVLVSRLMFNLRDPREHPAADVTTTMTTTATSAPTSTMILLHTLTNVEYVDEPVIHEPQSHHGDIEMTPIVDHGKSAYHVGA